MRYNRSPLYVALIVILILTAAVLYLKHASCPANATGCDMVGMSGIDLSDCEMGRSGSTSGHHLDRAIRIAAGMQDIGVSGRILAVDKARRRIAFPTNPPLLSETEPVLSKAEARDRIGTAISVSEPRASAVTGSAQSRGRTVTLGITGTQCPACADRVRSSLKAVDGMTNVTVTANPARATVVYDPAKTSVAALKGAIRNTKPCHTGIRFGAVE